MVHLVLTVDMMAWRSHCSDERPVLQDMSPMACMVEGQQVAPEWVGGSPEMDAHAVAVRAGRDALHSQLTRARPEAAGAATNFCLNSGRSGMLRA
jgi:hypothetical protein